VQISFASAINTKKITAALAQISCSISNSVNSATIATADGIAHVLSIHWRKQQRHSRTHRGADQEKGNGRPRIGMVPIQHNFSGITTEFSVVIHEHAPLFLFHGRYMMVTIPVLGA